MKSQVFASMILASLTFNAFALPESQPQPLLGELHNSQSEALQMAPAQPLAENGADRVGRQRMIQDSSTRADNRQIAEGGADRVGRQRMIQDTSTRADNRQIAEGGADRVGRQRIIQDSSTRADNRQIAEGGAERLLSTRKA